MGKLTGLEVGFWDAQHQAQRCWPTATLVCRSDEVVCGMESGHSNLIHNIDIYAYKIGS